MKLVLLTRHAGDLAASLARWRLETLFDAVHHLEPEMAKTNFITTGPALFIDDSYRERQAAGAVAGLTTLAPDQVELLIDERI